MTDEPAADAPEHSADQVGLHIADRAALLVAAAPTDDERRSAEEHAAVCLPCREALAEAVRLNALLKRALRASGGDL
jgi:hypothetical protein